LWRESDGDLADFGRAQFIPDEGVLDATFTRLEVVNEQLDGHLNEMLRELKQGTDLDLGPLLPVDPLLSSLDPSAHLSEDLFRSKVAFSVLLNFPVVPLQSKLSDGEKYSRRQVVPKVGQGGKQLILALLAPHIGRLASLEHLGIARVECCAEPRLLRLIQITYFGPAIDTRLVYPANGIVGQFVESHGTGKQSLIAAMSRAAVAVGADGLIVEVHPCPERALSDGPQSLDFAGFEKVMQGLCAPLPKIARSQPESLKSRAQA